LRCHRMSIQNPEASAAFPDKPGKPAQLQTNRKIRSSFGVVLTWNWRWYLDIHPLNLDLLELSGYPFRMNTRQDDPARTAEGAGRTAAGIEIFAEEGMGKPPGATLGPPGFRCDEVAATGQEDNRPGRQAD
jgi:hypothetical protein